MNIIVKEFPNCTWELIGTNFTCIHDEQPVHEMLENDFGRLQHVATCIDEDCNEDVTEMYLVDNNRELNYDC